MSDVISISLEETNKLRLSLGLKPIELEPEPQHKRAEPNLGMQQPKTITKKNEVQQKGPQLELDDTLDDTEDWLEKLSTVKPIEKTLEVVPKPEESSEEDLKGTKIGHSIQDIANLKDGAVFTLKDRSILDDEADDDELEEESLVEKHRVKENLKVKLGRDRQKFKGYEEENPEEEAQDDHLILNGNEVNISSVRSADVDNKPKGEKKKIVIMNDDLEEEENEAPKDYQDSKPIKIKKIKKMATKHKRAKTDDSEADKDLKYVELAKDQVDLDDDYELQSALSSARKKALKKRKISPEEFVSKRTKSEEVKEEAFNDGMVIDDTAEFLNSLKREEISLKREEEESNVVKSEMEDDSSLPIKAENDDKVPMVKMENEESSLAVKEENEESVPPVKQENEASFAEESFGSGLGDTLRMLQQRSILGKQDAHAKEIKQRQRELLKAKEILDLKKQNLTKSEVDQLQKIDKEQQQLLKNYNPVVNISYHDDKGNALSTKEAYKQLSHQFHGKAPSNGKMGKVFKKRQQNHQ